MASGEQAAVRRDWSDSIIVALGGNLAADSRSSRQVLQAALAALPAMGVQVSCVSRFWRSKAWPDPSQPPFLNAVALVTTALGPERMLQALHGVEAAFGRTRGPPNAARPLDLDLIAYGRRVSGANLVLPHPRAAERLFVMGPLAEIAPEWRHPLTGETARHLATRASVGRDAAPIEYGDV